ncbi:MAG: hypothetical protein J0L87_03605 [Bacteroidetes bacterium]|nr:hypothetical protein [Bacteroidota bacterium]
MKRIVSFILAMYFFGLSAKTCPDAAAIDTYNDCKIASCVHLESGHADHHAADSCSPLCTCSCCGGVTLVYESSPGFKASFTPLEKPLYSENLISEISFSVWQPPKI